MKITPLLIFFTLLFLFLLSILVYRTFQTWRSEGFISFKQDKNPLSNILIPPYSTTKPVMKIYDNFYFDQTNYNLIEVNGTAYNNASTIIGNIDDTGSTINNIFVVSPCTNGSCIGKSVSGTNSTDFSLSQLQLPTVTTPWSYISQTPSSTTDSYEIFFIPIPQINTVISYIANLTVMKSLMVLKIKTELEDAYFVSDPSFKGMTTPNIIDNDPNNGNMVIEPFYDPVQQVYQISTLVKFDYTTFNLLVKSSDGRSLSIYDYSKNQTISSQNVEKETHTKINVSNSFSPWTVVDQNNNLIVYIPVNNDYTLILILQINNNQLSLYKSVTFQRNIGLQYINGSTPTPAITPVPTTPSPATASPTTASPTTTAVPTSTQTASPISDAQAQCYLDRYPDLQNALGATNIAQSKIHWTSYGYKEGRDISCPLGTGSGTNPSVGYGCGNSGSLSITTPSQFTPSPGSCSTATPSASDPISNYYNTGFNVNDYVPKTSLIPPVSCPNGICSKCTNSSDPNSCSTCGGITTGIAINTPSPITEIPPILTLPTIAPLVLPTIPTLPSLPTLDLSNNLQLSTTFNLQDSSANLVSLENGGNLSKSIVNGASNLFNNVGSLLNSIPSSYTSSQQSQENESSNPTQNLFNNPGPSEVQYLNTTGLMSNEVGLSGRGQNLNQRSQYFGKQNQKPNLSSQYGAQSGESSIFIPITSDFSKFSK